MLSVRHGYLLCLFSACCDFSDFALTPVLAKLSMQPESSDGFASVGTILPKEKAALLPGGFLAFWRSFLGCKSGVIEENFVT
jgi:hypothetical protein